MKVLDDKKDKMMAALIGVMATLFYLGIALFDGPIWCVDSQSYVSMDFSREPFYPTFLGLLRSIFGGTIYRNDLPVYLFVAVIIQSLLWIYATCMLSMYVYGLGKKYFEKENIASLMAISTFFFSLLTPVLNRFIVKRQSMYSESIMTESLAMPLFIICCVRLCRWLTGKKKSDLILLAISSLVIVSIRKQMLVVLLMWFTAAFIVDILIKYSRDFKRFLIELVLIVIIFFASKFFDSTYNFVVRGVFHEHTGNSMGAMCTLIYSAGEEDIDLFSDDDVIYPGERQLFSDIYNECSRQELLIDSARNMNWLELTEHYSESYDVIGYDIASPACYEYLRNRYPDIDDTQLRILESELEKDLVSKLIRQDKKDLIIVALANLARAFVYSNAKISPRVLQLISAVLYLFYAALMIQRIVISIRRKEFDGITIYGLVTIIGLAINCAVVGLIIFPQGRYMAYATGLFYSALVLMMVPPKFFKK